MIKKGKKSTKSITSGRKSGGFIRSTGMSTSSVTGKGLKRHKSTKTVKSIRKNKLQ